MSMTKKDFVSLAETIKAHNRTCEVDPVENQCGTPFMSDQLGTLADFCRALNPEFKRDRWLGYIAGTNGPNGGKVD